MLMHLADEGDFLLLFAPPAGPSGDDSDWVVPIGEADNVDDGWVLIFTPRPDPDPSAAAQVEVLVEVLHAAPTTLDPEGEIVEVSSSGSALLTSGDIEVEATATKERGYRIRLTKTGATLLVQSWPSPPLPMVVLRAQEPEEPASAWVFSLPGAAEALEAARRIGDDIDQAAGATALSGELGTAVATVVVAGKPSDLIDYFDQVFVWTPDPDGTIAEYSRSTWDVSDLSQVWRICAMPSPEHLDHITGWRGAIWSQAHPENNPPEQSVLWWRWMRREPPAEWSVDLGPMGPPVLARDTVRVARFASVPGDVARTEITIEHRHVPVEWVDDLSAWWGLQLAIRAAG